MSQMTNTFVIDVPTDVNKYEVADAVAKQFEVEVKSVRLINRKGKTKRVMNTTGKRSSNRKGTQADVKKAYITLAPGSHLPFFAATEEEIAKVAKEAESKKKDAKKADKSEKKAEAKKPAKKEAK